jgi:hypothetical protein
MGREEIVEEMADWLLPRDREAYKVGKKGILVDKTGQKDQPQ